MTELCDLVGIDNITIKLSGRRRNIKKVLEVWQPAQVHYCYGPWGYAQLFDHHQHHALCYRFVCAIKFDFGANICVLQLIATQLFVEALTTQSVPHDGVEGSGVYMREVYPWKKLPCGLRRGVDVP